MLLQLKKPSKSQISAAFALEILRISPFVSDVNIFLTGRTGSGKTTLINLLAGENNFRSTGFTDCTDEVNLLELPIGLKSFDLPGVCSDDRLENYNRAAFGMEQLEDLDCVDNLTIATKSTKCDYKAVNFSEKFKLDLIFYLFAPDKQFLRHDREYLTELLKHHHQVIYLFNMFVNEQGNQNFATPQNIAEATAKITKIHKFILGEDEQPKIIQVNCKTGEGIDRLFEESREILGLEKGKLFQVLIDYQNQKTPRAYTTQVMLETLKLCADVACQKPSKNNNQTLWKACQQLWDFFSDTLLEQSQPMPKPVKKAVKDLALQINSECVEKHYEDEYEIEYEDVYEDKPIYETRLSPSSDLDLIALRLTLGLPVPIQKVFCGYQEVFSHTKEFPVKTGRKIFKGETYHYFENKGITFMLAFTKLISSEKIFQYQNKDEVKAQFDHLSRNIAPQVYQLVRFSNVPEQEQIYNTLKSHLLDESVGWFTEERITV
ncbi:MAG: GTPase [Cyanobacteria bacterium P01_A01_bin.80]